MAYLAVLVGIFIAGAVTSAGVNKAGVHHADVFPAHQVWLYATVLTIGYVIGPPRSGLLVQRGGRSEQAATIS